MFLRAARTLAAAVTDERLAQGALYPPLGTLRAVSRAIAIEVASEAVESGLAGVAPETDLEAVVDGAMWWPDYVPYVRGPAGRAAEGPGDMTTTTRAAVMRRSAEPATIET